MLAFLVWSKETEKSCRKVWRDIDVDSDATQGVAAILLRVGLGPATKGRPIVEVGLVVVRRVPHRKVVGVDKVGTENARPHVRA